jgi:GntR family transcriptional regulator
MLTAPTRPREIRALRQRDATRRLRDVLRSNIIRGAYPEGRVPSESELMGAHRASRAVVREALAQLREEGMIERVQGIGTYAIHHTIVTRLVESHGVEPANRSGVWAGQQRPRVIDRSIVPTPDAVAPHLPGCGPRCLRVEYVGQWGDEPFAVATNYLRFPEADAVDGVAFETDFYALLEDAGLTVGASEFLIGCSNADVLTAELLGVPSGAAVATMEQVIFDRDGRPFDYAFISTRADRFMFLSRAERPGFPAQSPSGRLP